MQTRLRYLLIIMLILAQESFSMAGKKPGLIPYPNKLSWNSGYFQLKSGYILELEGNQDSLKALSTFLSDRISQNGGPLAGSPNGGNSGSSRIRLELGTGSCCPGNESYLLTVSKHLILIQANTARGMYYGITTLMQLFPVPVATEKKEMKRNSLKIPCVEIFDEPRFPYRGMHLDVCRHFFPLEFVKRYIDLMSRYKMNTFHWHLTDDQGWRIEIKKYPQLTGIGAFRKGSQVAKLDQTDDQPHGGYYTQEQIRELVAYAAARYVTVIPEIEMPGHSVAALAAYPHLSCKGGPFEVRTTWGVADDVFCAGNDSVFMLLEDVLSEVITLFPSPYIHIGGDEVPKTRWESCPKCQTRIKNEKLANEEELQSYFIHRIEKFLSSKGRKIIGWDEILEGGLAPSATVMSWRGMHGGVEAAKQKHTVIMTPGSHCYFDHYQADPAHEPLAIGGFTTLNKVYSFEPIPAELSPEEGKYILGAQSNLWAEYIPTPEHAEYMAYPRALALSEVNWTRPEKKDWNSFIERLNDHFKMLDYLKVNYSKSLFDAEISMEKIAGESGMAVKIKSDWKDLTIRYTLDGSEPTTASEKFRKPFIPEKPLTLKAALFDKQGLKGRVISESIYVNKAFGKPVTYLTSWSKQYPGQEVYTLVNGIKGNQALKAGSWQGFNKDDMEVVIDLEKQTEIRTIKTSFLKSTWSWIFYPKQVEYYLSDDGQTFRLAGILTTTGQTGHGSELKSYDIELQQEKTRYIKIKAVNQGVCPAWHGAAGQPCWLFVDEVIVE